MPRTCDAIENDRGKRSGLIEAPDDRARRLRHGTAIDDEYDAEPQRIGKISRAPLTRFGPVKQAHGALDDYHVGALSKLAQIGSELGAAHRPRIEVEAGSSGCRLVEARIDIVGSGLGGGDLHPAIAQSAQYSERDNRLAAPRTGSGNDHASSQSHSP